MERSAILILAAGGSTRLGSPKQLLPAFGTTLLRHAAVTALGSALGRVTVVLGAWAEECTRALEGLEVDITVNAEWESGMGSSIAAGMAALSPGNPESVLIMLCDQPAVTPATLHALHDHLAETGADAVASWYHDVPGPPVIFTGRCFPELRSLRGPEGARTLFARHPPEMVDFPGGAYDIDTPAQAEAFRNANMSGI